MLGATLDEKSRKPRKKTILIRFRFLRSRRKTNLKNKIKGVTNFENWSYLCSLFERYPNGTVHRRTTPCMQRVCENNDILILRTYIDRAMTGTNDNRPDFRQMIEDSKNTISISYSFTNSTGFRVTNTKPRNTRKRLKTTALKSFPQPNIFPIVPRRLYSKV